MAELRSRISVEQSGEREPPITRFMKSQFFGDGPVTASVRKPNAANVGRQETAAEKKVEALEAKLVQKNEVIAELLQEHVQLKKANGDP